MTSNISAVLVTRGDVDLQPVLDTLPFEDVVIWDNSQREDMKVYGRYCGVAEAKHDWIYVQDDDLTIDVERFLDHWDTASGHQLWEGDIFANTKLDERWNFVGSGAIFHRSLISCFDRYLEKWPMDYPFLSQCDFVFTYMNPYKRVYLGETMLPWHDADNRMYKNPAHYEYRETMHARALTLTDERYILAESSEG